LVLDYFIPVNSTSSPSQILSDKIWEGKPSSSTIMLFATGTPTFTTSTVTSTLATDENTKSGETPAPTPPPVGGSAPTVVSLIKSSIVSLKGAYANYLKISVLVRNILGL